MSGYAVHKIFSRKERKEMKGGYEVRAANGITQFAVRRTKKLEVYITK